MSPTISNLLDDIVINIKDIYGDKLKEIVLYGSYAKGNETEDSDIDIMVLVDMDDNELRKYEKKINDTTSELGYKYIKVISLMDMSYDKFNYWKNTVPFYKNIKNEGRIIYG